MQAIDFIAVSGRTFISLEHGLEEDIDKSRRTSVSETSVISVSVCSLTSVSGTGFSASHGATSFLSSVSKMKTTKRFVLSLILFDLDVTF